MSDAPALAPVAGVWMRYGRPRPCVSFKAMPEAPGRVGGELARVLESWLRSAVAPDAMWRLRAMLIYPWWSRVVEIHVRSFAVILARNNWGGREWTVLVGVNDAPLGRLRRRAQIEYFAQLTLICRTIHTTLARTAWVNDIRWYFQKYTIRSSEVATPDELPWNDAEHK